MQQLSYPVRNFTPKKHFRLASGNNISGKTNNQLILDLFFRKYCFSGNIVSGDFRPFPDQLII
jgi:hypothetical protein